MNLSRNQFSDERLFTSLSKSKEKENERYTFTNYNSRNLFSKQTKTVFNLQNNIRNNYRKISSINYPSIKNFSNINNTINQEVKDNNIVISYATLDNKNRKNLIYSKSNDFHNNIFFDHKKLSLKKNPSRKKETLNSPLDSQKFRMNGKIRWIINKKIKLNEKASLCIQRNNPNNKKELKLNFGKNLHKKKLLKKSCELNQDTHYHYKTNILKKINSIRNSNNLYLSIFENNSNSVDLIKNENTYNNRYYLSNEQNNTIFSKIQRS